jgi:hypothetical protein
VNTGVFESSYARRIREPVTVIFSTDTEASSALAVSCAKTAFDAIKAVDATPTAMAKRIDLANFVFVNMYVSLDHNFSLVLSF